MIKKILTALTTTVLTISLLMGCSAMESGSTGGNSTDNGEESEKIVASVVAGGDTSGALTIDGKLYMWGNGEYGLIGNGSRKETVETPQEILTNVKMVDITNSREGSVSGAVTEDGTLYLWGTAYCGEFTLSTADELKDLVKEATGSGGSYGYQGNEDNPTSLSSAVPIPIMGNITYFATNSMVCAAIDNEGNLYTWGFNGDSLLGRETTDVNTLGMPYSAEPEVVLEQVKEVSISYNNVAAVTDSGDLYMWGNNEDCQIGSLSDYGELVTSPQKVAEDVQSVFCGGTFTAIIKTDGNLYTWGNAQNGRLGNGETSGQSSSPILILENVVQVGGNTTGGLAITGDGDLYIWGNPIYKYMDEPYTEPQLLLEGIVSASMGFQHLLALDTNGTVYAWGWNAYGQLGSGTTDSMQQPGEVQLFD